MPLLNTDQATITLHLNHHWITEEIVVNTERWQLLESGIVVRRTADGHLLDTFYECRATDIADGFLFCGDGRVLGPNGEIGRFNPAPTLAVPHATGWIALVHPLTGLAIQQLGSPAIPLQHCRDEAPEGWVFFQDHLVAAWDGDVERIDLTTGECSPLLDISIRAEEIVVVGDHVVIRGRIHDSEYVAPQWYELAIPDTPKEGLEHYFVSREDSRLVPIPSPPRSETPEDPLELTGSLREPRSSRWGLMAFGFHAWGAEYLTAIGWEDIPSINLDWRVGPDGEVFALDWKDNKVRLRRWSPEGFGPDIYLPQAKQRVLPEDVFFGPDGRWWVISLDKTASVFDGKQWVSLGYLPLNPLAVRSLGPDMIYGAVEHEVWRYTSVGFEKVAEGVVATWSPAGLVTWDGHRLQQNNTLLFDDPSIYSSQLLIDGCGRIWLAGLDVVVWENGHAIRIKHPMLQPFGTWYFGDITATGVILSDLSLVVQVERACPTTVSP